MFPIIGPILTQQTLISHLSILENKYEMLIKSNNLFFCSCDVINCFLYKIRESATYTTYVDASVSSLDTSLLPCQHVDICHMH